MAQARRAPRSATPRTRRRTWNASRADTTAANVAPAPFPLHDPRRGGLARSAPGRPQRRAWIGCARASCPGRAAGQPTQADVGDLALGFEVGAEGGGARRGQPVRAAPVVALDGLDHAMCLESAQRLVKRPRREPYPREGLDVLGQRSEE